MMHGVTPEPTSLAAGGVAGLGREVCIASALVV